MKTKPGYTVRRIATSILMCTFLFALTIQSTIVSATAWPLFDLALTLDGVDDFASAPDNPTLDLGIGGGEDFTIETFFYVADLNNTTNDTLFWKQGSYGLYILFSNTQADRFIYRVNTSSLDYVYQFYETELSVGWHHVAAVFDNEYTASGDLLALYVDGSLAVSSTAVDWTPGIPNSSNPLYVGAYGDLNPLNGWMEEARFSNVVRYNDATYSVPAVPFASDANTRALWHFNGNWDATTFADSSGNQNTLTGVNGARIGNPSGIQPTIPTKTATSSPGPAAFKKTSPVNNALKQSINPTLKWAASKWATSYEYCVDLVNNTACDTSWIPVTVTSVSLDGLLNNTVYYWQVRALNGTGTVEANAGTWWNFTVKYPAPVLVSPVQDEDALALRPMFDWEDESGAGVTGYTLQISKNNTFTQTIHTGSPIGSSYVPTVDLPKNATLYWRVLTRGANGPSAWSEKRSFNSANSPSKPVLLAPVSGILLTDDTPLLKWKPVTLPSITPFKHYQVQVDDDSDFSSLLMDDTTLTDRLPTQLQIVTPLVHNTKYYWRVRAVNTDDEVSNWSARWNFRIKVDAPILLTPADNTPVTTSQPVFDWEDVTGPGEVVNYTIQVSTSPTFSTLIVNAKPIDSTYTRMTNFPAGKKLYWRVRVNGPNGPSAWPTAFSFNTPSCWAQNNSEPTTCAEEDNINIPVFAKQIDHFQIVATHPVYDIGVDNCNADFSACNASEASQVLAADTCTTLGDNGTNIVKGCTQPAWWRPYKMKITVGPNTGNFHYLVLYQKIQDEDSWPQFLVLYQDGNLRLKPHPSAVGTDTCFGSSVIIGPAVKVTSARPYADIQRVQVDLATLATDVTYRSGGTAHLSLSVDRLNATVEIDVNYAASAARPFAIFRSMYVADGNADVDHIRTAYGDFPILNGWTQLGAVDVNERWWFFHRSIRSIHNTSAPDITVEIIP